jgi:hypothetical protein
MKGQYFSFDAIIASIIFILALVALLSYWHSIRSFLEYQSDPLSKDAIKISNLLFTPPSPSTSCASISHLGFASSWSDKRVNSSILTCASSKDQDWLRDRLGTAYNVSMTVTNLADHSVVRIGGSVPSSAMNVVKIRRLATVVNNTGGTYLATVDMALYK